MHGETVKNLFVIHVPQYQISQLGLVRSNNVYLRNIFVIRRRKFWYNN